MERILTQEEIDKLLSACEVGEIDARLKSAAAEKSAIMSVGSKDVYPIDLTKGQDYSKWRIANLEIVFNSFARYFSIGLSNSLQHSVIVNKEDIVSKYFEHFLSDLNDAGVLGAFSLEPLKGHGVFVFDKVLCFGLVEMLFGMSPDSEFLILDRDVTAIEANSVRTLMIDSCNALNRAFSPLGQLNSRIVRVETNTKMLNVLSSETEVIQVGFSVKVGDLDGKVLMVIPYFSLEPYRKKFREEGFRIADNSNENNWTETLEKEVRNMEIPIFATWGELVLTIQEILGLEVGDIIALDYDESAPIKIRAGQKAKFRAQPGLLNGKKAMRIVNREPLGE